MPKRLFETYGILRKMAYVSKILKRPINHKKMQRICKEYGYNAKIRVKKYPDFYYQEKNEAESNIAENKLNRNFDVFKQLTKLVCDVSFFKLKEGWLYLSVIMDLYNREIVAFKCSKYNNSELVVETVKELSIENNLSNVLIHSDQGATYKSYDYQDILEELGCIQSMSRKGNCWDNACIESFFGTLKCETNYHKKHKGKISYSEMENIISEYIRFFNKERIQKRLNWQSPIDFKKKMIA